MSDKSVKTLSSFFRSKLLNARTIEESLILIKLMQEDSVFLKSKNKHPLIWNVDKPLCQYCFQEPAEDNNYCPLCIEVFKQIQELENNAAAGILTNYEDSHEFMDISDEPSVLLNENEFLAFLPHFKIAEFLNFLKETATNKSPIINIVFTGRGDMLFCDALAMARYYAKNVPPLENLFMTKFFFNHSHMRILDFKDFYSFNVTKALFDMASSIKSAFSGKDITVILDLLKEDDINRVYELNRFYSMCNQDQKTLLEKIKIDESDPDRLLLLFQVVRYVY